jgi:glycerol-3-phosphate dehydrogenase (NAD(P)+)
MSKKIGVIGAGAWGTALSLLLAENKHTVTLWMFENDLSEETARTRENRVYLPGFTLTESITVTSSLETAARDKSVLLFVMPSHTVRTLAARLLPFLSNEAMIICASKGIELDTLMPLSEVLKDVLPPEFHDRLCFLSGPSFAREVAQKMPTAISLATYDSEIGKEAQKVLSNAYFRVYTNPDVVGVELAGALKNVVAIAAGVLQGLGFGHNSMAALLTRGLAEMARLGSAMGANLQTFSGLAGIGDLVLTCTGGLSRNRSLGVRLGKGERLHDIMQSSKTVAEGVKTARAARDLAKKFDINMPIVEEVYQILYEQKNPVQAARDLMSRELKGE